MFLIYKFVVVVQNVCWHEVVGSGEMLSCDKKLFDEFDTEDYTID